MRRRQFLASGTALLSVAVAGCGHPSVVLDMDDASAADIVVHDGNRYRVAVDSRTAPEAEYRYEVTEVASGVESFADQVREEYLFTLTGLSDAEREVVEEAIDGGYFQDDDAFRSVTDRIRQHEAIDLDDFFGTWLLAYEGVEYLTYAEW